MAWNYMGRW
jgi:hypothetical protein